MPIIAKKDYQAKKFYKYEWTVIGKVHYYNRLSIEQAEKLAKNIIKAYGISFMPEIIYTNSELASAEDNYLAYYDPRTNVLKFGKGGHNKYTFLHEMAHFITHVYFGCATPGHGKEYVGIHANLFHKYLKIPYSVMYRKLNSSKIKYIRHDKPDGIPTI